MGVFCPLEPGLELPESELGGPGSEDGGRGGGDGGRGEEDGGGGEWDGGRGVGGRDTSGGFKSSMGTSSSYAKS